MRIMSRSLVINLLSVASTFLGAACINAATEPAAPRLSQISATGRSQYASIALVALGGVAQFSDLQAPIGENGLYRADGTSSSVPDSSVHSGFALGLGLTYRAKFAYGSLSSGIELLRASASGSESSNSASYVRYGLNSVYGLDLPEGWRPSVGGEMRRSYFRNTDNGHYVDSFLLKGGLEKSLQDFFVAANGAYSPYARVGFSSHGAVSAGGTLQDSSATITEWGLSGGYRPSASSEFKVTAATETAYLNIRDVEAYKRTGLRVSDIENSERPTLFQLQTSVYSVSLTKHF